MGLSFKHFSAYVFRMCLDSKHFFFYSVSFPTPRPNIA